MIFKVQTLAMLLLRSLLLAIVFNFLRLPDAAANIPFSIENVASLAKKLATESFKPPQPIPDFLRQLSYDDYRDIRFDLEQSLWKETGNNFQVQFIHPGLYCSSRATIGRAFRRWRVFLIPEELAPPQVIKDLQASLARRHRQKWEPEGFVRAAIDPYANAVHVGLLRGKMRKPAEAQARNRFNGFSSTREAPA
jgi:hypothetical protein